MLIFLLTTFSRLTTFFLCGIPELEPTQLLHGNQFERIGGVREERAEAIMEHTDACEVTARIIFTSCCSFLYLIFLHRLPKADVRHLEQQLREKNRISVKLSRASSTPSQQQEVREKDRLARSNARRKQTSSRSVETLTPKQQGEAREKNRISVKLSRATLTTSQQHEVRKKNTLARSKARRQQRESLADQHVQEQIHSEYKYACSYIFVFSRAYIFQADTSSTAQHVQEHVHSEYKYTYLYICILQGLHFSSGYQQHSCCYEYLGPPVY